MVNFTLAIIFLLTILGLIRPAQSFALEEVMASYAGPTVTFLPAEVARQRGFMREQNLDVKMLLTRSEVDRAALASGGGRNGVGPRRLSLGRLRQDAR